MLFATTETVSGYRVEPLGLLMDTETLGLHLGRDVLLRITDWIGGRSRVLDKQAQVALETAASRLAERAERMGANAVVGIRLWVQPVGIKRTAMVQATIYGTAARLVPLSDADRAALSSRATALSTLSAGGLSGRGAGEDVATFR